MSVPTSFETAQEQFWAGDFGTEYSERNVGEAWIASNTSLFSDVLKRTRDIASITELGANIGLNLIALQRLLPRAQLTGLEINPTAHEKLAGMAGVNAIYGTLLEPPDALVPSDLLFTKGVLIHIAPEKLEQVYDSMFRLSKRYICLVEYYNPSPVTLSYRGVADRLFKRDFAGDLLERFPKELSLVDYGFRYRRDPNFPQDDTTWFLLEKAAR